MIQVRELNLSVGDFALRQVSLEVRPQEYFVLLGPTGSGKTLLVECLCGLHRLDSGEIHIAGRDVTRLEPRQRGVGYLPQDYALFPHKTVRGNIGFGLLCRSLPRYAVQQRVEELMADLDIAHLAERYPLKLSGGERQRVALARALAVRPEVLLLDEPVSALDELTRDSLCALLRQTQRRTGATILHVCHNFAEMLSVADRVGIIQQGRVLQVGTAQEILQHPESLAAARFVRAGNLLPARARDGGDWIELICPGDLELHASRPASECPAGEVTAMVRPENIQLVAPLAPMPNPQSIRLTATLRSVSDLGALTTLTVACNPEVDLLVCVARREYSRHPVVVGEEVSLEIAPEDVHVIPESISSPVRSSLP